MSLSVILNFKELESFATNSASTIQDVPLSKWLTKAIKRHVMKTQINLVEAAPSETELKEQIVKIAVKKGEPIFRFSEDRELIDRISYVRDWLADLRNRDPGHANRISRSTFEQAFLASTEWHRRLALQAQKAGERSIPESASDAPTVLEATELGPGWKWVWLKTDKARDLEGESMGHCVGQGYYDHLDASEGIFSLRDPANFPHVTLHLSEDHICQVMSKGNATPPARYSASISIAARRLGNRLTYFSNPTKSGNGKYRLKDKHAIITIADDELHSHDRPSLIQYEDNHPSIFSRFLSYFTNDMFRKIESEEWYDKGVLHRSNGPALITDNTQEFWRHGHRHREDGPAIISEDKIAFYNDGRLHRVDGPALIERSEYLGAELWSINGMPHRDDGLPAVIVTSNPVAWIYDYSLEKILNPYDKRAEIREAFQARQNPHVPRISKGSRLHEYSGNLFTRSHDYHGPKTSEPTLSNSHFIEILEPKLYTMDVVKRCIQERMDNRSVRFWLEHGYLHRNSGPAEVVEGFSEVWRKNGSIHRENGPAISFDNSEDHCWVVDGKPHRNDAPAIQFAGQQLWYRSGFLHREDGPAVISDKFQIWFRNGLRHRVDGPAFSDINGDERWYRDGLLHRVDGPAVITKEFQLWFQDDVLTRSDGPAVTGVDLEIWFENGRLHNDLGPALRTPNYTEWHTLGRLTKSETFFASDGPDDNVAIDWDREHGNFFEMP